LSRNHFSYCGFSLFVLLFFVVVILVLVFVLAVGHGFAK
jgi:dolichol kinase